MRSQFLHRPCVTPPSSSLVRNDSHSTEDLGSGQIVPDDSWQGIGRHAGIAKTLRAIRSSWKIGLAP